jgi:uncharacterized protein (TIGR02284 family)
MAIDNEHVIATLNHLIETCKDGQQGFQTAADGVKNSELKMLFHRYSQQRGRFVAELQQEVSRHGGDPAQSGSVAASLHHGWVNIVSAVTGRDESAIIEEALRGEDSALKAYSEALRGELPADIRPLVERHADEIRQAHDHIHALERAEGTGA